MVEMVSAVMQSAKKRESLPLGEDGGRIECSDATP